MIPVCTVVTGTATLEALLPILEITAVTVMKYVVNARSISFLLPCTVILVEASVVVNEPECVSLHGPVWLAPCAGEDCIMYLSTPN